MSSGVGDVAVVGRSRRDERGKNNQNRRFNNVYV